jgi:hypothetical protein
MVNFGFTGSTAGIGQAGPSPACQSLIQRANSAGDANAGFFGMLLALFTRPLDTDLTVVPEVTLSQRESGPQGSPQETALPPGDAIVAEASGEQPTVTPGPIVPVVEDTGLIPENSQTSNGMVGAEDTVTDGSASYQVPVEAVVTAANETQGLETGGSAASQAPAEASPTATNETEGLGNLLGRVLGGRIDALERPIEWASGPQPAEKSAGSGTTVWPAAEAGSRPAQAPQDAPRGDALTVLPGINNAIANGRDSIVANRAGVAFTDELIKINGGQEPVQSKTLEAFARMADSSNPPGQALGGKEAGQVTATLPGRSALVSEESNGVLLTAARAEEILSTITKIAPARRVEPVVTRGDVENAFVFTSPQGVEIAGSRTAPVEDGLAQTVIARIQDQAVGARATGKTTASFEITTESGEMVRVRIAIRSNTVSARIGVMDSETREILALHVPELSQRLQSENLVPERFEFYVMDGGARDGQRREQRGPGHAGREPDEEEAEDAFIYVSSEPRTFEKWA